MKDIEFSWDEEEKTAYCWIKNKGHIFYGVAICDPDDYDMVSPRTGQEIAFRRAKIKLLCHERDYDIKPRLAALNHLYGCMKHSSKFNPESYENTMLQRQIRLLEFDLATVNEMIQYERKNLKEYINAKDQMYKHIREKRKGQE